MARVQLKQPEELSEESKKAYEELNSKGKITNMKLAMLQDYGTYKAFMGWYDSWASLVKVVGQRAATIYAHSESRLRQLGQQIVKDPTKVSDELLNGLRKYYNDTEIIVIVGFGAQMQATNNFNSVLGVDLDKRLLPVKEEFKAPTWRENIK